MVTYRPRNHRCYVKQSSYRIYIHSANQPTASNHSTLNISKVQMLGYLKYKCQIPYLDRIEA